VVCSRKLDVWLIIVNPTLKDCASVIACRILMLKVIVLSEGLKLYELNYNCPCKFKSEGIIKEGGVGLKLTVALN
jgi:hypothetical protein